MRYLEVAADLRTAVAAGAYGAGGALESEAELGGRFGVSRVTVRRALEELRREGLVTSRRGAGWFVALDPVCQVLGRVTTVEAALEASGATAERRVLEFGFEPSTAAIAAALHLEAGAEVLRVRRLTLADGEPFALVTVWLPGALGAQLSRDDAQRAPFYELLAARGTQLGSATQLIGADLAGDDDVRLLGLERGAAVLACRRVTTARDGMPVVVSEHRYPAHRTTFEIDFPFVEATSEAPGLRLVNGS
ncbi:MAG TPA: GntR family transcriptional regulator [Acidimicrobiia bacterium]|nr:GntR family transcriptional regulator [Acidimicrobiia bacterium]